MTTKFCSESAADEWHKIVNFTHGLQRMNKNHKQRLTQLFTEQSVVWVGYLHLCTMEETKVLANDITKLIGKNGYWLKKTTREQNLYFSWYDKTRQTVIFWGPKMLSVWNGIHAIETRLNKQAVGREQAVVGKEQAYERSGSITPPVFYWPIVFKGYDEASVCSEDEASIRSEDAADI